MNPENHIVLQELERLARNRGYSNYTDVGRLIGLDMNQPADRNRLSKILDDIAIAEHNEGRPLLPAVVISRDQNIPGEGFFELARQLGLYGGGDDLMYWINELRRVHEHWDQRE